ncbi:MAG: cation:proton antiporter [Rhodothermales bacterium]
MTEYPFLAGLALPFLGELVALFAISIFIAYLCYRIRIVPIVGFLIAGALIGPYALGFVEDIELVNDLAEIGVILLLFTIGVEFSLQEMKGIGSFILTGGGLQVGLTIAVTIVLLGFFGVDWQTGFFTGCLVALSSTAVVLRLLSDRAETDTPAGRLSLGILIFQDLAIIAMVLLVPLLGDGGERGASIALALLQAVIVVILVVVAARIVVPRILEWMARTRRQELFILTVVAICFGTAWLISLAGISLALGAFLAGLVVSESRYREQALSEILPLRTIFNAVFFVSIGMLFNAKFLLLYPLLTITAVVAVLVFKFLVTTGTILALRFPVRIAVVAGVSLAQIGEFSFVLQRSGEIVGLTPAGLGAAGEQAFIAVAFLLMLATPFLVQAGPKIGSLLSQLVPVREREAPLEDHKHEVQLEDHVIVVGFGPAGQRLAQVLRNTGIPFVVIELNPATIEQGTASGLPIMYGDAARLPILEAAGAHTAKVLLVAINDPQATMRIVSLARYENPTLQIIARTRFIADMERLQGVGADIVVPEEMETSVRLFSHVLNAYMISPEELTRQVNLVRADDYGVIRGSIQEAHMMVLQGLDEEGLHTRAVAVREGAPVASRTLAELELRNKYGLTVLAVRRGRKTIGSPAGSFRLEPGDRLVLIGMATQFAQCADLFRDGRAPVDRT